MSESYNQPSLFDGRPFGDEQLGSYSPLVIEIAAEYHDQGLDFNQLVRAASSGLELAFDLKDNCPQAASFKDYAAYWVRRGVIGGLVAQQALADFVADFQHHFSRRPNFADIRQFNSSQSSQIPNSEKAAYNHLVDGFMNSYYQDFDRLPNLTETNAFGQARREQMQHRLASYISEFLLVDSTESAPELESDFGELYIPNSWLDSLDDEARQVLILRYGLDGTGIKRTQDVGSRLRLKTRAVGEILAKTLLQLAEDKGISSEQLLVYPHLLDGMAVFEREVLTRRLGVFGRPMMEFRALASALNVSTETARGAELRAINYLNDNATHNLRPTRFGRD